MNMRIEQAEQKISIKNLRDVDAPRIETALALLGLYLGQAIDISSSSPERSDVLKGLEDRLRLRTSTLDEEFRVRVRDDDARFELRTEDGRVRVDVKDGEVRIREKVMTTIVTVLETTTVTIQMTRMESLEIEADIFTDTTVVKVEMNDTDTVFTTSASTRDGIIAAIKSKFSALSTEEIDAVLILKQKIEQVDRTM